MQIVEKANWLDASTFTDRFGRGLYTKCLSTGSKILLGAHYYYPERVYNGNEMGYNCIPLLLGLKEGNLYFEQFNYKLPDFPEDFCLCINGNVCSSKLEAEEILDEI